MFCSSVSKIPSLSSSKSSPSKTPSSSLSTEIIISVSDEITSGWHTYEGVDTITLNLYLCIDDGSEIWSVLVSTPEYGATLFKSVQEALFDIFCCHLYVTVPVTVKSIVIWTAAFGSVLMEAGGWTIFVIGDPTSL